MSSGPFCLVDGTNLLYRAYHAIRGFTTSAGLPTHAAYGFLAMLLKLLRDVDPAGIAVAFDPRGPTTKHELFPEYKANREKTPDDLIVQLPYVKRIVEGLGISFFELPGYEADDVLGTLAQKLTDSGERVLIVSGDKDFCQLIKPGLSLYDTMKDKISGPEEVVEKFGVRPERIVDLLALVGDSVDNLPGVPGIGVKTGAKLLNEFGGLEKLVDAAPTIKGKRGEAIVEHGDRVLANRPVVTIDRAVPVEVDTATLRNPQMKSRELANVLEELEFKKFLKDLKLEGEGSEDQPGLPMDLPVEVADDCWVGFLSPTEEGGDWAVALGEEFDTFKDEVGALAKAAEICAESGKELAGYDLKEVYKGYLRLGKTPPPLGFDCEVAAYLLNPEGRGYTLESTAFERGVAIPKGAARAKAIATVATKLEAALKEWGMDDLFCDVEMQLVPILARMEHKGVKVKIDALNELGEEYEGRIETLEAELFSLAGETFNPRSSKQLGVILFEKLGLPVIRKTKTGYSTEASVLEELSLKHELPAVLLEHRRLTKLKNSFIDVLPGLVDESDGRIHAGFHQTVTATGRLSSSNPNLQNVPVKGDEGPRIRSAFVADPGRLLLSADYSQIELRLMAHFSGDPVMVEAFRTGQDVHTQTAMRIHDLDSDDVDGWMRRQAKTVNFGILYGVSPFGLARQTGLGVAEAAETIKTYFERFPGVRAFIDKMIRRARTEGGCRTLYNRWRPLPDLEARHRGRREFAERTAVNTPLQGTAADLIKIAMIKVARRLEAEGLGADLILQVHDELVFEVDTGEVERVGVLVKEEMEGVAELDVPLVVDVGWGPDWYSAHGA